MEYRKLGSSGAIVTAYALGTMTFGAEFDEATSFELMDDYAAAGGNFIDTADVYSAGLSEEIVGRWLKSRTAEAAQMVVATKGRFPMGNGPNDIGLSRRHLGRALDDSLRRLGVEQIDLYQMHAFDALTPLEETLRFLDDSVRNGKIAYYGFSNFSRLAVDQGGVAAKANGYTAPVTLQPQYNLLVRDIEHEIVPACLTPGWAFCPGRRWRADGCRANTSAITAPTGATRLGEDPNRGMEAFGPRNAQGRTWDVIDAVSKISKARGVSMAQVALAWVAAQPAVTSVLLGARKRDQLADNLAAAKLVLSPDEIATLSAASAPEMSDYPYGKGGIAQRHRKSEGGR